MTSSAREIAQNLPALQHPDGSPIRALVADDEPMLEELVSVALKMNGWEVRSASDGPAALGLPIVKAIVKAHGGSIEVISEPGNTEFSVRLPLVEHED